MLSQTLIIVSWFPHLRVPSIATFCYQFSIFQNNQSFNNTISLPQVKKYFNELPIEFIPIVGSAGDFYRDQQVTREISKCKVIFFFEKLILNSFLNQNPQLIYQIPVHDLNIYTTRFQEKACRAKFEKFVKRRNEALDVAHVQSELAFDTVRR